MKETHTYTHPCLPLILQVHKHTHTSRGAPLIALPGTLSLHTHTSSCLLEIWLMMTHTYIHPYSCPRLIAGTNTYFSFTFTEAFPLHACGVTCNLHSDFTSVPCVFLVAQSYCRLYWETSGRGAPVF